MGKENVLFSCYSYNKFISILSSYFLGATEM